jgi:hypothetical protein
MDEFGQTGDAGESPVPLFPAAQRDAILFFDANGEFERVKGVEAEAAAHEHLIVADSVRLQQVGSEQAGDAMLQSQ